MSARNEARAKRFAEVLDAALVAAADVIREEHHRLTALDFCDGMDAGRAGWALVPRPGAHVARMSPHAPLWRAPLDGGGPRCLEAWVWCPWECAPARIVVTHHGEAAGDDDEVEVGTTHPVRLTCQGCGRLYDAHTGEALP